MDFTYPKIEKLKSKKTIDSLFTEGKSVGKYPLRLVYRKADPEFDKNRHNGKKCLGQVSLNL